MRLTCPLPVPENQARRSLDQLAGGTFLENFEMTEVEMTKTTIQLVDWLEDRELTPLETVELLVRCLAAVINAGSSAARLEEHIAVTTGILADTIRRYQHSDMN